MVQSSRALCCEGGHIHFFTTEETTPGREKKTHTHTPLKHLTGFYVSPSVCEMSTKAEQCKYDGLCMVFLLSCHWGFGNWKCDFCFSQESVWGELSLVMKPRLPWEVATRPLTAEDGWRLTAHGIATCIWIHVQKYVKGNKQQFDG